MQAHLLPQIECSYRALGVASRHSLLDHTTSVSALSRGVSSKSIIAFSFSRSAHKPNNINFRVDRAPAQHRCIDCTQEANQASTFSIAGSQKRTGEDLRYSLAAVAEIAHR